MLSKIIEKLEILLFFSYIVLVYIFGGDADTTYYYAIVIFVLFIIELFKMIKTKRIKWNIVISILLIFTFYCLLSSFWAEYPEKAINRAKTLAILSIFLIVSFNMFMSIKNSYEILLKLILWAGFTFSIYIICYYNPINYFNLLITGKRIGAEISNVNLIGLQTSISVLIALFFATFKDKRYYLVLILPLIVALGTGSRKALITIILGFVAVLLMKFKSKITLKNVISLFVYIIAFIIIMNILLKIDIFSSAFSRFENMINAYINNDSGDSSIEERNLFITSGIEAFKNNPIFGLGAGNSNIVTYALVGKNTYLHNNFVELLATLGVIGFCIYYYIYIYLVFKYAKMLKDNYSNYLLFSIIFFMIILILDYGVVSYYSKSTYIYFLYGILILNEYKNRKEINYEKGK